MLRDSAANVLMHNRRSFVESNSLDEVKMIGLMWAIDSMHNQKINIVVFAMEAADLVGAVSRSQVWLSFSYQISEILVHLCFVNDWKVRILQFQQLTEELFHNSKCVFVISDSILCSYRLFCLVT